MGDKEAGDSTILPQNDADVKQGQSYGYPGLRGSGAATTQIEPKDRPNGKLRNK